MSHLKKEVASKMKKGKRSNLTKDYDPVPNGFSNRTNKKK